MSIPHGRVSNGQLIRMAIRDSSSWCYYLRCHVTVCVAGRGVLVCFVVCSVEVGICLGSIEPFSWFI